jgi:16S rRNA (cytosine1402-N4)-methyltransferase
MHKSVLLKESIDGLSLKEGEVFLDGTFGGGGHSKEVRQRFGDKVQIIGLDQDPDVAKANPDFEVKTLNFRNLDQALISPDAILLDIGISSDQIDASGRGFSFQRDEPLDMRMSQTGLTAAEILNSWDEHAIELILRGFGEEKYSQRVAKEVVRRRETHPFERTGDLVEAILSAVPSAYKHGRINPATRTFQALRIAVNEELVALEEGLIKAYEALKTGGRVAVITFHSLEDRIVKNFFRRLSAEGKGEVLTKKPITPSEEEIEENPRARSAKLRIFKKQ